MTAIAVDVVAEQSGAVDGFRDMFPGAVGVLPFATMIGVAVGASPMSDFGGWIAGLVVAGGSAHLAMTASMTVGASVLATVVTALLINSRSLIYGALLAPALRNQPRWFRWVASYALVDQLYALTAAVTNRDDRYLRHYYLGAMAILWSAYMFGVGAGIVVGPIVPASIPLSLAIPILFLAMAIPSVKSRASQVAAAVALVAAMAAAVLPAGTGMVVAIVAGTAAGALMEGRSDA
jgi:predicted branched-subunit amino acid permease